MKHNQGFTLVELAIVIAILGILAGGIMSGQSLIRAAEIQATISDLEKYQKSIGFFQEKYHALPGDYSLAETEWGTSDATCPDASGTGTCKGNGNQEIAGAEQFLAWQHLSLAEMVEGSYTGNTGASSGLADTFINVPKIKISDTAGVMFDNVGYIAGTGADAYYAGLYKNPLVVYDMPTGTGDNEDSIIPKEQWNIDRKIDDGLPQTGNVRSKRSNSANCIDGSAYNLDFTTGACALVYMTGY